MDLYSFKDQRN